MTLSNIWKSGTCRLSEAKIEEARLDAWLLLEYVTGIDRAKAYAWPDTEIAEEQEKRYFELIEKRAQHIPLQHLTHQAFFWKDEFYVNEHVLIPRQDTEILVEEALKLLQTMEEPRPELLDMCTGSGCILFSILGEEKNMTGVGVDLSGEALKVAERNRLTLHLEDRAELLKSDLFSSDFFSDSGRRPPVYDMIVSNPPYITVKEIETLMEEVREHDPYMALCGGEDGLTFYREITRRGKEYLKEGGFLLYEIGAAQGQAVKNIMLQEGFENIVIRKDLAGLDRVVSGRKKRRSVNHV